MVSKRTVSILRLPNLPLRALQDTVQVLVPPMSEVDKKTYLSNV